MPQISGPDIITFYIIAREQDEAVRRYYAGLAELAEVIESEEEDANGDFVDKRLNRAIEQLGEMCLFEVQHRLTIYPRGNPQVEYYSKKYGLVDPSVEYDASGYLEVLFEGALTLREFPTDLVRVFDCADVPLLLTAMRALQQQPLFHKERESLSSALARLSVIDAGQVIVVLWYASWMP